MTHKTSHEGAGTSQGGAAHAKALEHEGWRLFEQNQWPRAAAKFEELLQIDPANEGGLQGKIACLRKEGQFDEAEALIAEALKKHPDSVGILSERAWLGVDRKRYDDAIAAFDEVLRRSQTDEGLYLWKLSLLRRQQRLDEAEEVIAVAMKLFPQSQRLQIELGWLQFYQNCLEDASDTFATVLKADPVCEAALQGQIASLRLRGQFAEAMRKAKSALTQLPESAGIHSEVAWLLCEQARFQEAEAAFVKVLSLMPADPCSYVNLAWTLVREGGKESLAQASKRCREALALDSKLPEAWGCLGIVAFKQGRILDAEKYLHRSIEADPDRGPYADLGALYNHMGRYDEAEQTLRSGMAVKRNEAALHLELGNLFVQIEKPKEAMSEFRQAAVLDPAHPDPPRALAILLLENGRILEAETVLRNAIRALDEFKRWKLHLTLCQVLMRLAEETSDPRLTDEALKEVAIALRLQPEQADPHFHEGIVRFKLEEYRSSLRAFQRCHKLDPGRVEAEINARRVRVLMRQENARSRASMIASFVVGIVVVVQLVGLWFLRLSRGGGENAVVTPAMLTVLVPVCLGLLVVSVVLPSLTKLKLTGLEAEMSEPKPKAVASGPKGEIGFGNASRAVGLSAL